MIPYNPAFLDKTSYLDPKESEHLLALATSINLQALLESIKDDKSIAHKLCFDFIYTSAVIEGNTYTRGEAQTLFETRKPISTKSIDEANMLLNIKAALEYVLEQKPTISKHTIREVHQILSQGLLPKKAQGGVRDIAVSIGNSDYVPLHNPQELELQMEQMLARYAEIDNPFDKAMYIHNNIAYLQYFMDCNKRLARTIQNLSLLNDGLPFLSLSASRAETEIKARYKDAMLDYYEKGDTKPYAEFFISEYASTLENIHAIAKIKAQQNPKLFNQHHINNQPHKGKTQ